MLAELAAAQRSLAATYSQLVAWHSHVVDGVGYDGEERGSDGSTPEVTHDYLVAVQLHAHGAEGALHATHDASHRNRWHDAPHSGAVSPILSLSPRQTFSVRGFLRPSTRARGGSNIYSKRVGSNKRYGSDVTRAAIAESVLRPKPVSLSSTEIGSEIRDADPNTDVACIPFRTEESVQVEGRVIAYTDRACLVEFTERNGLTHRVWVWASAVERKQSRDA